MYSFWAAKEFIYMYKGTEEEYRGLGTLRIVLNNIINVFKYDIII